MKSAKDLKLLARQSLAGKYSIATGVIGIYLLFQSLGTLIITQNFVNSIASFLLIQALAFGFHFLMELVKVGLSKCFLDLAYGNVPRAGDLFWGLRGGEAKKFMAPAFMLSLIPSLCMLPSNILSFVVSYSSGKDYALVLGTMLLGFLVEIYFEIIYSQVYFVGLDIPGKEGLELLSMSKWLMKERFGKYLWLVVSFIPMYILCITSMGIGVFWVLPYVNTTKGHFYLEVTRAKMRQMEG